MCVCVCVCVCVFVFVCVCVCKVNYSSSLCDSSQVSQLEEAFEQLQYFIEDLDHANGEWEWQS